MKTTAAFLIVAVFSLASCRSGGGPTTRACCMVDYAIDKTGQGSEHVGHSSTR
ncbi:hypothetical protein [Prosthecobacter sp.]|uniref:hypothetical protein n=1 Tax=Prosthecobacter sp. TaxID=1965333 RepID=UPI00248A4052|nr:hypothetical protein [Prosthecobacter sp.]MDI1312207.1 hypothetical protein [Prosthecobacter sp.]